ncbi:MAG: hypothetical protein GWN00_30065 [Aliifodinibius sp.]|nr:hypothetical protein [Fodinibius sp.]NIY28883.1 hypothetical protein [Fodinibius sp.]
MKSIGEIMELVEFNTPSIAVNPFMVQDVSTLGVPSRTTTSSINTPGKFFCDQHGSGLCDRFWDLNEYILYSAKRKSFGNLS